MAELRGVFAAVLLLACTERAAPPVAQDGGSQGVPRESDAAVTVSASTQVPNGPTVERKSERLVVVFGGDVSLGRGTGRKIIEDGAYDPFRGIAAVLGTADVRMANLESQLSEQQGETESKANRLIFTGPPAGARVLARAGFQLVSFANNHVWDYGKRAFLETLDHLSDAGVRWAGASREPDQMYEPAVIHVKGWTIALFAVTDIWNQGPIQEHEGKKHVAWAAFAPLRQRIAEARRQYDLVFVSYHGGAEYSDVPMTWTRAFVAQVMAEGVDALFGHHPHVPQGVGWYGGRPVFFSLGNFVFPMHSDHVWTGTSFLARMSFHADGRRDVEACPFYIMGHAPLTFEGSTKPFRERAFSAHLRLISAATGGTDVGDPGESSCMALSPVRARR